MQAIDLIGNTRVVELEKTAPEGSRFFLKLEEDNLTGSIKARTAKSMIEAAIDQGSLRPGDIVIEATSGNTGIALAALASLYDYKFIAVMPEGSTKERIELLEGYGADIIFSPKEGGSNMAIEKTKEIVKKNPELIHLNQYENENNVLAHYNQTGPEILRDLPEITHFVAGLGTGGTLTGAGQYLKEQNPKIQIIAAEPDPSGAIAGLRSLQAGYIPPIFDIRVLDRKILISSQDSIDETRALLKNESLLLGISTGSNIAAAKKVASPGDIFLIVSPDGGERYLSTGLFSDQFRDIKDVYGWW